MACPTMALGLTPTNSINSSAPKEGGYGNGLKDDVKRYYGSVLGFGGRIADMDYKGNKPNV